jgi:methyl-accepting chemotaxis protein
MPEAEANKWALHSIRNMRYGGSGYFTIINSRLTVLMHAARPDLNDKDVSNYKDPNGVFFFRDMAAVIRRDGNGFTV